MQLFWDYMHHRLVASLTDNTAPARIILPARDQVPIDIQLLARTYPFEPYTPEAAAEGWEPRITARATVDAADLLIDEDTFTSDAATEPTYSADVDADTEALVSALGARAYLDTYGQLTLENAAGERKYSTPVFIRFMAAIAATGVPPSSDAHPPKIVDNVLYLWNDDLDQYTSLEPKGTADTEHLVVGEEHDDA